MEFGELCLLTTNVPRLADFYKKVLRTSSDCDSEMHQAITIKGVTLAIYNNGRVKNSKNENMVFAFTVDNVDQAYERLSQLDDEKYKAFLATTKSKYNLSQDKYNTLELEQEVIGEVLEYDTSHSSFQLKYITHHDVELKEDISNELF